MSRPAIEDDLEEQPVPDESRCPKCGGEPLADEVVHNLSAIGYQHDDIQQVCEDCGHQWANGRPIGEFDRPELAADLWCDSCDDGWMLVHRVARKSTHTVLHLKCPECYHFDRARRTPDDSGVALVGYPQITGATDGCQPYGYQDNGQDDGQTGQDDPICGEPLCIEHGTGTIGCPLDTDADQED